MWYAAHFEHLAQKLGGLDGGCTNQNRSPLTYQTLNFSYDGGELLALGTIDKVVHIDTRDGTIGGDDDHIELVDIPELARLGLSSTSHTGKFLVHAEVVLQRDGGIGLRGSLDFGVLLGLDSLVQTVAPAATLHDTASLLVNNLHLVVLGDDVIDIALKKRVGFQQLVNRVNTVALYGEIVVDFLFLGSHFLWRKISMLEFGNLASNVRQLVELWVLAHASQLVHTFVGEFAGALLLVDDEIELVVDNVHILVLLLHVEILRVLQQSFHTCLGEELNQSLVFRQSAIGTEQKLGTLLFGLGGGVLRNEFLGLGQNLRHKGALFAVKGFNDRLEAVELLLVVALACGTTDDERGTSVVDKHRVHLVDNGIVVRPLHQFFRVAAHIVAQVIETELVVRSVGNIAVIGVLALVAVWFVFVDTIDGQAVELEKHTHPLGVALSQVVVHRDHMHPLARQSVKIDRQSGHKGLTLTSGHLSYLALVEDCAADELHVVVDHIPRNLVAAGHPVVVVVGLVALDIHAVESGTEVAVVVSRSHLHNLVLGEAASRFLNYRECLGKYLIEHFLCFVVRDFFEVLDMFVDFLFLAHGHIILLLDTLAQLCELGFLRLNFLAYALLEFEGLCTEPVVGKLVDLRIGLKAGVEIGFHLLEVAVGLSAEKFRKKICH